MANPVTYNSGNAPAGGLKFGTMSLGVDAQLNISGYNWRNGFENNNIWVIYSDTFSMGLSTAGNAVPSIWATPIFTESALVTLINSLSERAGQTPFGNITDAINWLVGQNKYFISNQNYPYTVTSNMVYFMDAGLTASYPNIGTSLYDLTGNGATGSLLNGVAWDTSNTKSSLVFDGSNDKVYCTNNNAINFDGNQVYTALSWIYPQGGGGTWHGVFSKGNAQQYALTINSPSAYFHYETNLSAALPLDSSFGSCVFNRWQMVGVRYKNPGREIILNGEVIASDSATVSSSSNTEELRLGEGNTNELLVGNIQSTIVWDRNLTDAEILQEYYRGPIVTTNLTHIWDSGNIVSYHDSGTTLYGLKGGKNGTLTNGVGYVSNYGGYLFFDGTDDYIDVGNFSGTYISNPELSGYELTCCFWAYTEGGYYLISSGSQTSSAGFAFSYQNGAPFCVIQGPQKNAQNYFNVSNYELNTWAYWSCVSDGTTLKVYKDGNLISSANFTNGGANDLQTKLTFGTPNNALGQFVFDGYLSQISFYDRALTEGEIKQNYGATRGRFETYQTFANGGTVSTVVENGQTYRVHKFTSSGTLSVVRGGEVELVMIGGGGSGGVDNGGGAGAGGLIDKTIYVENDTSYNIVIGAGGAARPGSADDGPGNNGADTTAFSLTAIGGGAGSGWVNTTLPPGTSSYAGGSGAGQSASTGSPNSLGIGAALQPTSASKGLGNVGGAAIGAYAGGGGGAGGPGGAASSGNVGAGGAGYFLNGRFGSGIGVSDYLGGGGAGGFDYSAGFRSTLPFTQNGTTKKLTMVAEDSCPANTGAGGNGSNHNNVDSGGGGSGIVLLRYPIY
jgi:hypothetical protein